MLIVWVGTLVGLSGCAEYPIDDNGLLITDRTDCRMESFELLGADHVSVLTSAPQIDHNSQTVMVEVKFGTNIAKLKPSCGLSIDAIVAPRMGVWTDFTSLKKEYVVTSGDRRHSRTYTVILSVQSKQ